MIDIRLGTPKTSDGVVTADTAMSEENASYVMLTPDVPTDREPSANTIGRYYDAYPLNAKEQPDLLVSWADGPVESGVLGSAGLAANFGIYLYDTKNLARRPLLDDPETAGREYDFPHMGRMPLEQVVDMIYTGDVFLHRWDLARATGQEETLDPERCAVMLEGMLPMDEVLRRSGQYGPRVEVPDDADVQTRLLAFIGRTP